MLITRHTTLNVIFKSLLYVFYICITNWLRWREIVNNFSDCSILDYLRVPYNFAIIKWWKANASNIRQNALPSAIITGPLHNHNLKVQFDTDVFSQRSSKKRKVAYSWFGMTKSNKCVTRTLHMFRWKKLNKNCHAMYMKSMIWKVCMKSPLCGQIKEFKQLTLIGNCWGNSSICNSITHGKSDSLTWFNCLFADIIIIRLKLY